MYGNRTPPEDPPCEKCRVELKKDNEQAAFIYRAVRQQIITFHNGQHDIVVDLDYPAVKMVMDLYRVQDQRECFEKVVRTFRHFLRDKKDG